MLFRSKTAEALEQRGLRPDLIPKEYRAESILEGLAGEDINGRRFLMPRALVARDVLPDTLRERGAVVDVVPAYETVLPEEKSSGVLERFKEGSIDCVTFTSSSTVSNFFSLFKRDDIMPLLASVTIACIGPVTAQTAVEHGLSVSIMPADYTIPGLTRAIVEHYSA